MFEQMRVYHKKHQYGTIVKFEKDTYYIDYEDKTEKIFVGSWLKTLFLTEEDSYKKTEDIDIEPYKEILAFDEKIYKTTNIYQIRENMKVRDNKPIFRPEIVSNFVNSRANNIVRKFWVEKDYPRNYSSEEEHGTEYDEEMYRYEEMMQEDTGYFSGYYPGNPEYELDDIVYDAFLKDPYDLEKLSKQDRKLNEMSFDINLINEANKCVLGSCMVDRNITRCIAILSNEPIIIGRHRFLKIIGIDVSTAKIVTIVDQNGRNYGYHSDNYKFVKLLGQTPLIIAKFELIEDGEKYNVIRIVSDFEVVDRFDTNTLNGLDLKYKILSQEELRIATEFKLATKIPLIHNKKFYMLVNFKDTIIDRNKNSKEYCIKMGKEYPRIRDNNYSSEDKIGKHFYGMSLISWHIDKSKNVIYFAEKLFGILKSEEEIEKANKKTGSQCSEEYYGFIDEVEQNDDFIHEHWEYDMQYTNTLEAFDETNLYHYDEFLDQNVHCLYDQPEYYEEEREEYYRMDGAYWFDDDEYVEGQSNENF